MKCAFAAAIAALMTFAGANAGDTPEEAALRSKLRDYTISQPGFRLPSYAEKLDDAYDRSDWRAFKIALDAAHAGIKTSNDQLDLMNWEILRLAGGGGYVIARLYAVDSWNLALSYEKAGNPEAAASKTRAVADTLYVFALITADMSMCKDASAPANREAEMRSQFKDVLRYGRDLNAEKRQLVIDFALRLERQFGPLRKNDEPLCRGGNEEARTVLNRIKDIPKNPEEIHAPRVPGKTYVIEAEGEYHPEFNPPEDWKLAREAARIMLPVLLRAELDRQN